MKNEDKQLLLKDLCARLPYRVKYIRDSWNYESDQEIPVIETLDYIDKDGYISHTKVYTVEDIKPCLFPLSSMTEEQKKELQSLIIQDAFSTSNNTFTSQDFYCKYHFDYRGLIPMGLAIEVTKKNNPYKE